MMAPSTLLSSLEYSVPSYLWLTASSICEVIGRPWNQDERNRSAHFGVLQRKRNLLMLPTGWYRCTINPVEETQMGNLS